MPRTMLPVLLLVAMTLLVGCGTDNTARDGVLADDARQASRGAETHQPADADRSPTENTDRGELIQDEWEVIYLQGAKVGHGQTIVRRIERDGQPLLETVSKSEMTMARFGESVTQALTIRSLQTETGELREFTTQVSAGPSLTVTQGRLVGDQLRLETSTAGKTVSATLPWQDDWSGFFAVEQSLRQRPMQPAEQRLIKELQPLFTQVADVRLHAGDYEQTALRDGSPRLLRIDSVTEIAGTPIESVLWTDAEGRLRKMAIPTLDQTIYRTTREDAISEAPPGSFDIGEASLVRLNRSMANPHQTNRAVYRVTLRDSDPLQVFATSPMQTVRRIDQRTAELVVTAGSNAPASSADPPTAPDLAPNNLIQSDDARVVAMARSVKADGSDRTSLARKLERFVHEAIEAKNFSQSFATAADVAETLEGDCTEHAVLLAALCRARDIPARVAIGLVYIELGGKPGFGYHMWTEAWTDDRWLPLDATLGRGRLGAAHLKLTHSNLEGADSYTAFLPVFRVMGQLELELLAVE